MFKQLCLIIAVSILTYMFFDQLHWDKFYNITNKGESLTILSLIALILITMFTDLCSE